MVWARTGVTRTRWPRRADSLHDVNRRIITEADAGPGAAQDVDGYFDRVLKCLPIEVIAVYTVVASAAEPAFKGRTLQWWLGMLLLGGTLAAPAYAWYALRVRRWAQLGMLTLAFVVVVAAMGGWFGTLSWWNGFFPVLGTVAFGVAVAMLDFGPPLPWRPKPVKHAVPGQPIGPPSGPPPGAPLGDLPGGDEVPAWPGQRDGAADAAGAVVEPREADEGSSLLRVWRGDRDRGGDRP
jgi:hypothetical protein